MIAGSVPPCGHCHACLLRARGFAEAGVEDPLVARLSTETHKELADWRCGVCGDSCDCH